LRLNSAAEAASWLPDRGTARHAEVNINKKIASDALLIRMAAA